ncbi:MAG: glycoside hydrolase family 15 protein [Patescibacteria group bacterium]|nr:glycoside hydrolase family 15 protein [Patescibacteria group bacterium]
MNNSSPDTEQHLAYIRGLQASSGLFMASAAEVATGYNKAWLRDNFYTAMAFEAVEDWETVRRVWRTLLAVLAKHEDKITWAAANKPHASWQYIHARYHPETFEEFWEEWGNKQNDAVGAILFKLGELEMGGHGVIESEADKRLIQKLIDYVQNIEYWHDPDAGMWEENEEVHASSIGAVVAGLKQIAQLDYIQVPNDLIAKGENALQSLLPRESHGKFSDLAQLSLIWPYQVANEEQIIEILKNLEYHLEKERGIVRYKTDKYYNYNKDGWSEEAEWTFGFPWLAIICAERGDLDKAREYLAKAEAVLTPERKMPELYYSNTDKTNENVPLAWSQSLLVVAKIKLSQG